MLFLALAPEMLNVGRKGTKLVCFPVSVGTLREVLFCLNVLYLRKYIISIIIIYTAMKYFLPILYP